MKIAVLTSVGPTLDAFFPPLIARWRGLGHEVVTASSGESTATPHTTLRSLSRRPAIRNFLAPNEISSWLSHEGTDVLVCNTAVASFMARAKRQPCPVVYFCHGLHWDTGDQPHDRVWQFLEQVSIRNTAGVVVINSDDEEWFSHRLPAARILRLTSGVGVPITAFPRRPLPAISEQVRLLWAGEFSERKRPWLAIETIGHLARMQRRFHLEMCGRGPLMQRTMQQVVREGLGEHVTFAGQVTDLSERLASSHALLITSSWEGLPRIGLEALAVGRPVFAFDVKGVRSLPEVHMSRGTDTAAVATAIAQAAFLSFRHEPLVDPQVLDSQIAADQLSEFLTELSPGGQNGFSG